MAHSKRFYPRHAFIDDKPRPAFRCRQCQVQAFGSGPTCDVCVQQVHIERIEMVDRRQPRTGYVKAALLHTLLQSVDMGTP